MPKNLALIWLPRLSPSTICSLRFWRFLNVPNVVLNAKFRLHGVVDSFSLQFCFADLACSIMELSPPPKIKI